MDDWNNVVKIKPGEKAPSRNADLKQRRSRNNKGKRKIKCREEKE